MSRARTELALAADMIADIHDHVVSGWSVRGSELEQAAELMRALDLVRCVGDYIDSAIKLLPEGEQTAKVVQ
jgi:hypothetical protein